MKRIVLNWNLTLEAPERVADGAGGFTRTWQALGSLWGDLRPRTGRLVNGEAGVVSRTGFRIIVRAAPIGQSDRPQPGQRFATGPRRFLIEAVTEMPDDPKYLICDAEEEVAP